MPAASKTQAATAQPSLPVVTLARLEEATRLIERLVDEHTSIFVNHGARYRERYREASRRELDAEEVAQIAAGMATSLADAKQQIDEAKLKATDNPPGSEVLLAAGLATSPEFLALARRVVALLELDDDKFRAARELGPDRLQEAIDEHAATLEYVPLTEARARASRAFAHFAESTGTPPGEAWSLLAGAARQAIEQAAQHLARSSSFSMLSPEPTDGAASTSSTGSPTATPVT